MEGMGSLREGQAKERQIDTDAIFTAAEFGSREEKSMS